MRWIDLAQDKEKWLAFVNKVKNFSVDEIEGIS